MNLVQAVKQEFEWHFRNVFGPVHHEASMAVIAPAVRKEIERFIDQYHKISPLQGLLLMGSVGCGKTSALAVMYRRLLEKTAQWIAENHHDARADRANAFLCIFTGRSCMIPLNMIDVGFLTHANLIKRLRQLADEKEYDTYARDYILDKRILMIDDFGRAYDDRAGWNLALQEEFFDYRWRNGLTLVITSNYTGPQLRDLEGWERIIDRIGDPKFMQPVVFPGGSKRQ